MLKLNAMQASETVRGRAQPGMAQSIRRTRIVRLAAFRGRCRSATMGSSVHRELAMVIRDILNMKGGTLHSIEPAGSLRSAVALMVLHDVGSLVVMDGSRMVGMVTFREVLAALDATGDVAALAARDIMVRDPLCGSPSDTIDELREMMTRHHVRYLPVKDGETLLGVVSFHDVAKAVIKETSMENRLLRRYIEAGPADLEKH
jgi:CBS domain-containing protein